MWPAWVWFSVMATGNHYWLDIAAGVGVALVGGTIIAWAQGSGCRRPCLYRCGYRRW